MSNNRWTININTYIWSLNHGLRSWEKVRGCRLNVLGKLKYWEIKKGHKIDKLCMMTFKLIGQELHTSGLQINQKWRGQYWQKCKVLWLLLFQDNFPPLNVYADSFVFLFSELKLCLRAYLRVHGFHSSASLTRAQIPTSTGFKLLKGLHTYVLSIYMIQRQWLGSQATFFLRNKKDMQRKRGSKEVRTGQRGEGVYFPGLRLKQTIWNFESVSRSVEFFSVQKWKKVK